MSRNSKLALNKKNVIVYALIVVFILATTLTLYYGSLYKPETETIHSTTSSVESKPKALIADGLYEDYPNLKVIEEVKKILEDHGYTVEVVVGENVSLDLFRKLTEYNVIVLRLHGGYAEVSRVEGGNITFIGLFTGLPWEEGKYEDLRRRLLVTRGTPFLKPEEKYVAALPKFFKEELKGRFPTYSVVVAASCYSLYRADIAYALFQKGLAYYIGWGSIVTVDHMDKALLLLFKLVYEENLSWPEAVLKVNKILGPDPNSKSKLHIAIPVKE